MATVLKGFRAQAVGIAPVVIGGYTAGSHSTGTVVSALTVANVLNGATIVVTVQIKNGATVTNWVLSAVVMQGGCLTLGDEGTRHALLTGDQVTVSSNIAASCDVIMTIAEIDA